MDFGSLSGIATGSVNRFRAGLEENKVDAVGYMRIACRLITISRNKRFEEGEIQTRIAATLEELREAR